MRMCIQRPHQIGPAADEHRTRPVRLTFLAPTPRRPTLLLILVAIAALVLLLANVRLVAPLFLPEKELVVANAQDAADWEVWVAYTPRRKDVLLIVVMADLARWDTVTVDARSSQPWVPRWRGDVDGPHGDMIALTYERLTAPVPMNASLAKDLARSFIVSLSADGQDRTIAFQGAHFAHPSPTSGRLAPILHRLRGAARLVD